MMFADFIPVAVAWCFSPEKIIAFMFLALPEEALVLPKWRETVSRLVMGDDKKYDKPDFKDAAMIWSGSLLVRASIFMAYVAYVDKSETPHGILVEFLTAALAFYGINRFSQPVLKEKKENE